jgi:hypothetical protein
MIGGGRSAVLETAGMVSNVKDVADPVLNEFEVCVVAPLEAVDESPVSPSPLEQVGVPALSRVQVSPAAS